MPCSLLVRTMCTKYCAFIMRNVDQIAFQSWPTSWTVAHQWATIRWTLRVYWWHNVLFPASLSTAVKGVVHCVRTAGHIYVPSEHHADYRDIEATEVLKPETYMYIVVYSFNRLCISQRDPPSSLSSKHETLTQCLFIAGPASATLAQQ